LINLLRGEPFVPNRSHTNRPPVATQPDTAAPRIVHPWSRPSLRQGRHATPPHGGPQQLAGSEASAQPHAMSSLWSWITSPSSPSSPPRKDGESSPDGGASEERVKTQAERLAAGSAAVRLDWAAASSSEQHVPKLVDSRGNATQSLMLSPFALRQIAGAVPARFAYSDWQLLYSTAVHGISLNTFYANTAGCGCCCLTIKDGDGNIFGGACCARSKPRRRVLWRPALLRTESALRSYAQAFAASGASHSHRRASMARARPSSSRSNASRACRRFRSARSRRPTKPCTCTGGRAPTPSSCSRRATTSRWARAATSPSTSTRTCSTARADPPAHLTMSASAGSGRAACRRTTTRPSANSVARCSRCGAWTTRRSRGGGRI
jgi:hypothetical protein